VETTGTVFVTGASAVAESTGELTNTPDSSHARISEAMIEAETKFFDIAQP
jgi:hypothetical protein